MAGNMPELTALLAKRDAGNRKLADELRDHPRLERDTGFIARVADAVRHLERDGAALPITPELRAQLAPAQQQRQSLAGVAAGSAISAMAQLYAALRPPVPPTPAPWEQPSQLLGDRLAAFERRMAENATANQARATHQVGERALDALDHLTATLGGRTLARVRDAAQSDPGGIQGVVEGMESGGPHVRLRTAFDKALQDRGFASAYDGAVRDIMAYGQARLKAGGGDGFEAMDRAIGQASQALPGRKPGKSMQDEVAEKAWQVAEFLKAAVLRVGAAISSAPSPRPTPGTTMKL